VKVELGGVPETLLWTLYHRSIDARRPDAILADPRAVALVGEIDYPFAERSPPPWLWGMDRSTRRGLGPFEELGLPRGRGLLLRSPLRRLLLTIARKRLG
jgi:O-methyltransferase involved in polyketide biosynthesis